MVSGLWLKYPFLSRWALQPPFSQHQNITETPSLKPATVKVRQLHPAEAASPTLPRLRALCAAALVPHISVSAWCGLRSTGAKCQCSKEGLYSLSSKGHGQPWKWGVKWSVPSLLCPIPQQSASYRIKGGFDVRSEASPRPFMLTLDMWGGPGCGGKIGEDLGFKKLDLPPCTSASGSVQVPSVCARAWLLSQ